jgi:hypothetical protein
VPVLKSQIRKFVIINPQIANPQICRKKTAFLIQFQLLFARGKIMYLRIRKVQIAKIYGLQIANPKIATFAEGPQN